MKYETPQTLKNPTWLNKLGQTIPNEILVAKPSNGEKKNVVLMLKMALSVASEAFTLSQPSPIANTTIGANGND